MQSLRERSKARRRDAIERAALRLFAEQGYDATTIADIAAAAEVAPRTVSLYFPAKVDLVMAHVDAASQRLTARLRARGPEDSLVDVFGAWLRDEHDSTEPELRVLRAAVFAANPVLRGMRSVHTEEALRVGSRALAERLGVPVEHSAVRIAVAAVVGVLEEYEAVAAAGDDADAARRAALAFVAGGLDALAATSPPGPSAPPP